MIAAIVFLVDQITKFFLKDKDLLFTTPVQNTGIAFGFFQGYNSFFIFLTFIILILIFFYINKTSGELHAAFGLLVGGALGNLFDRIVFGHVIDFIDVKVLPIFNVADASNSFAVLLLLFYLERSEPIQLFKGRKLLLMKAQFCRSSFSRMLGLMFSLPLHTDEGLLIPFRKKSITNALHMFFVFFPIDIFWLDEQGKVIAIKKKALPFTPLLRPQKPILFALETAAGAIALNMGDIIYWKRSPKK